MMKRPSSHVPLILTISPGTHDWVTEPFKCTFKTRGICPVGIWSLVSCRMTSWYLTHLKPGKYMVRSPRLLLVLHFLLLHSVRGVKERLLIYMRAKQRAYTLIHLMATFTANVGSNTDHGKHLTHTSDDTFNGHVMTNLMGIDFTNGIFLVVLSSVRSKHNVKTAV